MKKAKILILIILILNILSLCSCGTNNIEYIVPAEYLQFYGNTADEGVKIIKNLSLDYENITINNDGDIIIEVSKEQSEFWVNEIENYKNYSNTNAQKEGIEISFNDNFTNVELKVPNNKFEFYNDEENLKDLSSDILFFQCILREQSSDKLNLNITVINNETGEQIVHNVWEE